MAKLHLSRRIQHAITGLVILIISYIVPPYPIGFVLLVIASATFYHIHWKRLHDETWDQWYLDRFGELLREHERGEWEDEKKVADSNNSISTLNKKKNHDDAPMLYKRRRKTPPALPGAFYFLLGTALSTLLFPTVTARTSLLILSIADPMAGLVGVWFSEHLGWNITWKKLFLQRLQKGKNGIDDGIIGGPSVAGSVACAVTTIICTYVYIPFASINTNSTIPEANISVYLSLNSRLCIGIITALTEAMVGRHLPVIGTKMADDNLLIPLVVGSLICWLGEDR